MENSFNSTKRKTTQDIDPVEKPKAKNNEEPSFSDDEKSEEKVIYVEETLLKFFVRLLLTIFIFGLLFYYLSPYPEFESQEDRIRRVVMEEKLRQLGIQEKGLRDRV